MGMDFPTTLSTSHESHFFATLYNLKTQSERHHEKFVTLNQLNEQIMLITKNDHIHANPWKSKFFILRRSRVQAAKLCITKPHHGAKP